MDYKTFRRHLGKAGLSVNQFARLLEVRPNAVSNHAKEGEVPSTYALLAVCLGELVDRGIDVVALLHRHEALPLSYWSKSTKDPIVQLDMFRLNKAEAAEVKANPSNDHQKDAK